MRLLPMKNVWVAAGDGDLLRVQELVEPASPNAPDSFTYTPMHAAASYGQLEILAYLLSQGGDVNVSDEDGDTPLYTVESIETARWLLDHGATIDHRNKEGISPSEHLQEEFPEIAAYLQSRQDPSSCATVEAMPRSQPSQHQQNTATEALTSLLIESVQSIMQHPEADGQEMDQQLRQVVGRTVVEGVIAGYVMTMDGDAEQHAEADAPNGAKKARTDKST